MEQVKLYDTTLRDGMGGHGMSLSVGEKLKVVQALDALGVHFIEAGFPSSNPKEAELFERLAEQELENATIAAFGMTRRGGVAAAEDPALATLVGSFAPLVCLVGKSWRLHLEKVIRVPEEENLAMIARLGRLLPRRRQARGLRRRALLRRLPRRPRPTRSECVRAAAERRRRERHPLRHQRRQPAGLRRRGDSGRGRGARRRRSRSASTPTTTPSARSPTRSPRCEAGARLVQGCVNGYGERCGNANLASILPALQLKMGFEVVSDGAAGEPDPDLRTTSTSSAT